MLIRDFLLVVTILVNIHYKGLSAGGDNCGHKGSLMLKFDQLLSPPAVNPLWTFFLVQVLRPVVTLFLVAYIMKSNISNYL